jgi:Glycosyl-transferase for dystroglycan
MVLPMTTAQSAHMKAITSTSHNTSNSFLLGGMYVPGKDKKRRVVPSRRRHNRVYRFRMTAEIVDLWQRLWYTSPVVAILVGLLLVYVILFWFLIPILSNVVVFYHEAGYVQLHPRHRGIDWLLTDTALLDSLPSAKEERALAERFAMERERVRKQEGESLLEVLEALVPGWYHRNDPRKTIAIDAEGRDAKDKSKNEKESAEKKEDVLTIAEVVRKLTDPEPTKANVDHDTHRRLLRTLQTMDMLSNNSHCPANLRDTDVETTLVVQSTWNRVWILDETCARWKAPIVAVVAVNAEENQDVTQNLAGWKDKCPQLNLIVYHLDEETEGTPEQYPVNALRNTALDAVQTSHILVVDVDFVPSELLHETIRTVLLEQSTPRTSNGTTNAAMNEKEAVVVPAFQRVLIPPCTTERDCRRHLRMDSSFIPHKFDDLKRCYDAKDCIVFQNDVNWPGHSSTRSHEWLDRKWHEESNENESKRIRRITCFDSLRYEPYVVIRWCPTASQAAAQKKVRQLDYDNASSTQNNHSSDLEAFVQPIAPYYDERFHGYGKNKIEHVAHLRLMGYKFSVLPEGFIVHNPHVESAVKETWNNVKQSKLHEEMDVLYRNFLHELVNKYYHQFGADVVDQCSKQR